MDLFRQMCAYPPLVGKFAQLVKIKLDECYERIEILQLEISGIFTAEYLTKLPPREILQARLHKARRFAQRTVFRRNGGRKEMIGIVEKSRLI